MSNIISLESKKTMASQSILYAARFKEARIVRGKTLKELADQVGVTRQAISKYEIGPTQPRTDIFIKIAEALDFPVSFFTKVPDSTHNEYNVTFFRTQASTSSMTREMIKIKSSWLSNIYNQFSNLIDFPSVNLPDIDDLLVGQYTDEIIEEIATRTRSHWGLGIDPINNLSLLLEKNGLVISRSVIGDKKADGCSRYYTGRPFIFLTADKNSSARSRFSLAHELGHMLMHGHIDQEHLDNKNELKRIEKEAQYFASAFLLPRESFSNDVISSNIFTFIPLKRRWNTSIAAMVCRCDALELFSDSQILYLNKQISYKKWRKSEPLDDELQIEQPSLLKTAAKMIIESKLFTKQAFIDLFSWPQQDVEELCGLPSGYLTPEVPKPVLSWKKHVEKVN